MNASQLTPEQIQDIWSAPDHLARLAILFVIVIKEFVPQDKVNDCGKMLMQGMELIKVKMELSHEQR